MTAALCWSPGSCSSGRRRKEGSAVFVVFLALPCFKYKATTHTLTVRQTPLSHGGKTDQSLCVCVCVSPSPLMGQMARQESWGCLQSCALKSSAKQGIICLRRPSVTLAPLVLHNGHSCTAVIISREIRFEKFFFSLTPVTELYLLLNGQNMKFKRYLSIFVHELLLVTLLIFVLSGNTYKTFTVSNPSCMFLS